MLPNSRALVMQQCGQCTQAGRKKGRLIRAQTTKVTEYLVNANMQVPASAALAGKHLLATRLSVLLTRACTHNLSLSP